MGVPERWTLTDPEQASLEAIRAELAHIGLALPGSLKLRSYRCGKPNCACHAEPPRLHGPYHQWSRRAGDKTVHVNIRPERADDCQELLESHRRLQALIDALETLSRAVVERDLRPDTTGTHRPARP